MRNQSQKMLILAVAICAYACKPGVSDSGILDDVSTGTSVQTSPAVANSTLGATGTMPNTTNTVGGVAPPQGCTGNSTATASDLVLISGQPLQPANMNTIVLSPEWKIDDSWGNAKLAVEAVGTESAVTFSNEGIFHGFKFTPVKPNAATTPATPDTTRRQFTLTGAEVYVQLTRANPAAPQPTFGLRIIKPGEFEGNGGAKTTTWMVDMPGSGNRFLTATTNCTLIPMYTPADFAAPAVGDRLIWEMQANWEPTDKLVIRKLILKGFKFVN